jgi:hypothetical protein
MELLMTSTPRKHGEEGFSILETLTALSLLAVGLLSLAGVFTVALARMNTATWDILAKEKASETIENILAARDSGRLPFASINNVGTGTGVFVTGAQRLVAPGPDRLIGTGDDIAAQPDTIMRPGPNGIMDGGGDDQSIELGQFTRQIVITSVPPGDTLRQVRVIILYQINGVVRRVEMSSYVSSFTG